MVALFAVFWPSDMSLCRISSSNILRVVANKISRCCGRRKQSEELSMETKIVWE